MNATLKFLSGKKLVILAILGGLLLAGGGFWALARLLPGLSGLPGVVTVTPLPSAAPATGSQTGSVSATATPAAQPPSLPKGGVYSMLLRLSEGQAQPQAFATLPPATGEPLSPEEIAAILARLPELTPLPGEQVDFKLPTELLPPPRPGSTVSEQFPPLETAPTAAVAESGPLQVLRFAPEGEIPVAPFISVTFSQPMVPLGTLADLAAEAVPVQVEPALPGTWRWLGTKTLTFEYDSTLIDRLPKATEYVVRIPAGIKSATGGVLADPVTWTFTTPAPKVVTTYPDGNQPQPLDPLFFVAFDQRIDPAAVLKTVQVTAGSRPASLLLASQAEIEKNETVSQLVKDTPEGRWLAFRASEPFPAETGISVNIGPGTPSAEGPLSTQAVQSYSFSTYAPLRIEANGCGWSDQCPPLTPFYIRFNNPLDPQSFNENLLTITPEIPGLTVNAYGNNLDLSGETKGRTTYTVTVSGEIQDIFDQKLGRDAQLTFKVGAADPVLVGPQQIFVTLDPAAAKPVFSVYSLNYSKLNVKIYAVQPTDWPAFQQYLREWQQTDKTPQMPGKIVRDDSLALNTPADTLTQVDLSLGDYLKDGFGQFVVVVEPPKPFFESDNDKWRRYSQTVHAWVQVTGIGLDALTDHSELVAWTTALKNGAPLAGVQIQPEKGGAPAVTGADGTIRLAIPSGASYLVARQGADQALLPYSNGYWGEASWQANPPSDELRWYVFDDRQMYKPGEEVHLKGWLRRIGGRQNGDVGLVGDLVNSVSYQVTDPQGNSLTSGEAKVNALGGFDFALTIPQTTNLGTAQIALTAQGSLGGLSGAQSYHAIQIQEFRRPEFEVTARNETSGPYFAGDHAVLAVEAKYYAGGALPNAEVTWQVNSAPGNYSPPNWPEFSFGAWTPWWYYDDGYPGGNGGGQTETFTGKTDASGIHYLRLDFDQQGDPTNGPRPVSINAYATVMDVNRQGWTSSTSLLVHPADVYIGLRSERYFVEKGTPLKIEYIVTDLDGQPVSGRPVEISAARLEWKIRQGNWAEEAVDVQKCTQTSASEPGSCEFATPVGGTYQITALVTDEKGRQNQSQFTRWVSGSQRPPSRKVEQEQVTLIPDKQTYQPGDVAEILVQAPFSPAEGLLTVTRSGILYTERFQIDSGSYTLKIPIKDAYTPNLNIQIDLTGSAPRTDDQGAVIAGLTPRPAYAVGTLTLNIPPAQRTLALEVTPDQARLEPGGETTLTVKLKDASGQPVPDAELAVVVVDEAILALTNYQLADPLTVFYTARPAGLNSLYGRASLILADPQALAAQAVSKNAQTDGLAFAAPAAAPAATAAPAAESLARGGGGAEAPAPIAVRTDFNPLAAFIPEARTGLDGTARISVKLPDNLTRYRVMVVAVDNGGQKFGTGESNLTARLPLMVRPSAPRFLNFGDQFELPVVLQNQTDSPLEVSVVARSANLELTAPLSSPHFETQKWGDRGGLKVTVPANDRVEVRFPAASRLAGMARVQFAAVSGAYADAATVELPVYTPATTEAFATYGVVDEGALAQPVQYPTGVFPQYGGLEINTSSTALQALTDAVLYLVAYPYECSEQLASRILAVAALRDVLTAFEADGLPSPAEMESAVNRDLTRLQGMQNEDGGVAYWRRGFESSPFNSIHVAHALARAKQKGFEIPAGMQENTLTYLHEIENHYPAWYGQQTRWTLSAYALYVRNLSGDRDAAKALALLNEAGLENLPLQALGWLWPVLDDPGQLDGIRRYVNNHVVETAGAANFTTSYDDQSYLLLSSDRRTDAVLLEALIQDSPQSDLIPKLVNGLLAAARRTGGRWGNTQENVFVLLALDKYFNTYEATTPDFVAKLWLGNTYAGSSEFRGRTTDRHETLIPMNYVLAETAAGGGTQDLILSKEGPGRLYYRLGLRYAPTDLNLKPLEMGFTVQRRYEGVDDPKDVYQDTNGTWHIKAGARVRVKIEMVTTNRRYHVALVDPLPAGLEIVNPALAVSGSVPQNPNDTSVRYGWWWWGPWYEHQNLRDDRAEAFTPLLWDGVYNYSYIARATTPGTFIVPPAKAEEMYSPEVFGRSGSDWVIVE